MVLLFAHLVSYFNCESMPHITFASFPCFFVKESLIVPYIYVGSQFDVLKFDAIKSTAKPIILSQKFSVGQYTAVFNFLDFYLVNMVKA